MSYARRGKTLACKQIVLQILKTEKRTEEQQTTVAALINNDAAGVVGYYLNRGYRVVLPHLVVLILMCLVLN